MKYGDVTGLKGRAETAPTSTSATHYSEDVTGGVSCRRRWGGSGIRQYKSFAQRMFNRVRTFILVLVLVLVLLPGRFGLKTHIIYKTKHLEELGQSDFVVKQF